MLIFNRHPFKRKHGQDKPCNVPLLLKEDLERRITHFAQWSEGQRGDNLTMRKQGRKVRWRNVTFSLQCPHVPFVPTGYFANVF